MRRAVAAALAAYLIVLLTLTFYPFGAMGEPGTVEAQLTPFQTIRGALRVGPGSRAFSVLVGNLLAFVPIGLLVPMLVERRRWLVAIGVGFSLSLGIEMAQWSISVALGETYRNADVDDVIVNTAGATVGYLVFAVAARLRTTLAGTG